MFTGAPQVTGAFLHNVAFGFLVHSIFRDNFKLNFELSFTLTLRLVVAGAISVGSSINLV